MSDIGQDRKNLSNQIMACLMFQRIYLMHCDINIKYSCNSMILITRMPDNI